MNELPLNTNAHTTGALNYLSAGVQSSLYRNGAVLIHRNEDGSDSDAKGIDLDEQTLPIADARRLTGPSARTLERNGFELIRRPLDDRALDFFDQEAVVRSYYPQCCAAVAEATGGTAFAFDHNIRSAGGKKEKQRIKGGQEVQGPAHVVHGDYTLTSGPQRLRDLANAPSVNDTYAFMLGEGETLIRKGLVDQALSDTGRFAIINVWRNIVEDPVVTHPMAFCDGQSVVPDDLVVFEIHYTDRVGENYFAKHSASHRWYTYPEVTKDEAILIKQWDSAGPMARSAGSTADAGDERAPCTFSFHSAFADPKTPANAADRWSIEVRCMVIY